MEWEKIYEFFEMKITTREYPENSILISENQICNKFNVSRITVRNVMKNLMADGYIFSKKGKGYFVNERKYWLKNISDSKRDNTSYEVELLDEQTQLPEYFANEYSLNKNDWDSFIKIRKKDGECKNIVYIFINNKMLKNPNRDEIKKSVVTYLKKYFDFKSSYSVFKVEPANQLDKKYLKLEDNSLVMSKYSIIYHNNEAIIQCAVSNENISKWSFGYKSKV